MGCRLQPQMPVTERSKVQNQGPVGLVSADASLPGIQMAGFLLNPQKPLEAGSWSSLMSLLIRIPVILDECPT